MDGGNSWELMDTEFPHIHSHTIHKGYLYISGKKGMLMRKKISDILVDDQKN